MIAKKQFRLEQVLKLRKEVERARMLEFAEARQQFEGATARLRQEEHQLNDLSDELSTKQMEGISAVELQLYSNFFTRKSADIQQQRQTVDNLGQVVAEKRETLLDAAKDKKVLESLKKKTLSAHQKEMAVKEQAFMDEIALRNNGREKK